MTTMKLNTAQGPPRVNWLSRNLPRQLSFKRQASRHWMRVKAGMRSWNRGRARPT